MRCEQDASNFARSPRDLHATTRRHFFKNCAVGVGSIALASLLQDAAFSAPSTQPVALSNQTRGYHPQPRAKNVISLFMAGGPSQLELFDYKPKLIELNGKPIPESMIAGRRFAFMNSFATAKDRPKLLGTRRKFAQHGKNGAWVSELLPHTAGIVDDITLIHSCATDVFNHAPAKLFMNTGSSQFGRPSMGAWVTYGLGSESRDLPAFVVMLSGPRGPRGGSANWTSGFLPSTYQGVPLRAKGDPILNLSSPEGITPQKQRLTLDAIR